MTIQIRPPVLTQENCEFRSDLRDKLNLGDFLKRRTAFAIGEKAVHCELYEHAVDAPTILFLPGIGTYSELYAEMLGLLSMQGYNVVGIDPIGHGYSGGSRGEYTVDEMVVAISQVIDVLQQRFTGPFFCFGYSIGSLLAIAAAEHDQRIDAVLCCTLLVPDLAPDISYRWGWNWTWASAFFMPGYKVPLKSFVDFEQLLKGHPAGQTINHDPLIIFDYPLKTLASLFTHRHQISHKRFDFTAAILHGSRDEVLPLNYSKRLVQYCEQPLELIEMPGVGHMAPFLQPEYMAQQISSWFDHQIP